MDYGALFPFASMVNHNPKIYNAVNTSLSLKDELTGRPFDTHS